MFSLHKIFIGLVTVFFIHQVVLGEESSTGLPLFYWQAKRFENFGDYHSLKLVERIVARPVRIFKKNPKKDAIQEKKFLAIGSIFGFASTGDVIWGSGISSKSEIYGVTSLDIRAVRGPLTRQYLKDKLGIEAPEIYGDPALLTPYFFPEYVRSPSPKYDYIIVPHYTEEKLFPKEIFGERVVYPSDPWDEIMRKIVDSKFVIASSLHGIIIAEAYGIPARMLKVTANEPFFKYYDYYFGTNRPYFLYATSVEEALEMGGESPFECDLEKLYQAFPFEFWPDVEFKQKLEIKHDESK